MAHDFNNLFGIVIGNLDIAVGQNRDEALQEPLKAALDTAFAPPRSAGGCMR